jgi:hypothetical protein
VRGLEARRQLAEAGAPPTAGGRITDRDWRVARRLADLLNAPDPWPSYPAGAGNASTFWQITSAVLSILNACGVTETEFREAYGENASLGSGPEFFSADHAADNIARLMWDHCVSADFGELRGAIQTFYGGAPPVQFRGSVPTPTITTGIPTSTATTATTETGIPIWGLVAGGVGLVTVVAGGIYLATRKKRRRRR